MKILVTGNMGYVGSELVKALHQALPVASLVGFDAGYFAHCLTAAGRLPETVLERQYFGDVRAIPDAVLEGIDAVVHLAAISNDPIGNKFESVTEAINFRASVELAQRALAMGASRFVFASSCSMYGFASSSPRREDDQTNPLSAYARSKVATEQALAALALPAGACVTSLRFSTACGMSDRLRLDLVLNDFVASALTAGKITVLSDGTPWRPLIDVRDMARAIEWALTRDAAAAGQYLAVNVGSDDRNYQVRDLAEAVSQALPGTGVSINTDAPADKRSYRVDFSLYRQLAPNHQPQVTLAQSIDRLVEGIRALHLDGGDIRASGLIRLNALEDHIRARRLDENLRWQ